MGSKTRLSNMKSLILIFPLLAISFGIEIVKFEAYPWKDYEITVTKSGIFNEANATSEYETEDQIKFKCLADRPWKKCWIYKEFKNPKTQIDEKLGCKSTHHAGYQVESNCDNGIEWSGSFRECSVTLLNANITEDTKWKCMMEEEVFIADPADKTSKVASNGPIQLTIKKKPAAEAPQPPK